MRNDDPNKTGLLQKQQSILQSLRGRGWSQASIARALSVEPSTVRAWHISERKVLARGVIRKKLQELVKQKPASVDRSGRLPLAKLKEQVRLELMLGIRGSESRARALGKLISELQWSQREMAYRLEISVNTLTKYLDPRWGGHIALPILRRILSLKGECPQPSLKERFRTAAKSVFGSYYGSGIPKGQFKRPFARALAGLMELDERAGYRLLASMYRPGFTPSLVTVIGMETAAAKLRGNQTLAGIVKVRTSRRS